MKYCWSREIYRSGQQQFLNTNFVWNQDEVSQNSRYAKRFYYSRQLSAQTMQHLAVRVKPISFALRACFLGHYRMARMSQSASSCGLASWMRPQMIPDTHSLKLLFLTRYTSRSIYYNNQLNIHPHPFLQIINTSQTLPNPHLSTFTSFYAIIQSSI